MYKCIEVDSHLPRREKQKKNDTKHMFMILEMRKNNLMRRKKKEKFNDISL